MKPGHIKQSEHNEKLPEAWTHKQSEHNEKLHEAWTH